MQLTDDPDKDIAGDLKNNEKNPKTSSDFDRITNSGLSLSGFAFMIVNS